MSNKIIDRSKDEWREGMHSGEEELGAGGVGGEGGAGGVGGAGRKGGSAEAAKWFKMVAHGL